VVPTATAVGAHQVRSSGASQLEGEQLDMVQDLTISSCPTTLPVTGADSMTYVRSGLALVGFGGLVLLAARRRREA
jgi:LPXTG-motif cell wall-anchored protein